jgi:DNA polymerase-1
LPGLDNVRLHLVDDFDTAWECMNWLGNMDEIAVDTETTGLVIGKDTVRLVQVGGCDEGWAIPWHRWSGLFEDIVKRFEGRFTMQNAKFDAGMLEHMGVHVPRDRIDDVRPMSHILEPNYSTALKSQASRYVDPSAADAQKDLADAIKRWGWDGVPIDFPPYWQYAALDTVLTAQLKRHHYPLVMAEAPEAYDLENSVTWVTEKMERHGAHIDFEYTHDHYYKFLRYCGDAEAWVKAEYGITPGSNQSVVRILQEAGYQFTKATAAGAVSLDKEVLEGVDHPLAQTVLKRRQLQKLASTYLSHFLNERDGDDYIHPSINTLGARTSRMSMERPNLQNLPRKSEKNRAAEVVRNCITASEGNRLLMCDFDQIEMRLLAHLSQDPGLISAFGKSEDFFVTLAREVFLDPTIEKSDPRRSRVKNVGYAEIYGAGIAKMAQTAGVAEDQIRVVKNRWDASYPGVKRFKQAVENEAWNRQRAEGIPYARSIVTGRRHVADVNKIYALVNYLIQGTAAEVFKKALLKLDAAGLGEYMVVPVHDEIILDVPLGEVDDVVQALRDNMNDSDSFSVPISASVSAGERWGLKEELTS